MKGRGKYMCLFCNIISGKQPAHMIYENDLVYCFLDKYPINQGHILVVPKKHYQEFSEVDSESLAEVMISAQKMSRLLEKTFNTDGITVLQDNGVFKDVEHYHLHIFPRYIEDGFSWIEPKVDIQENDFKNVAGALKKYL